MSSSGIAAQFTWISGLSRRWLPRWSARATSSLPVPLSPVISTVAGVGAARSMVSRSLRIAGESPISSSGWWRSSLFSRCRRQASMALRSETRTRSRCSGFSKKSYAPRFAASTAVPTSPWPLIISTGMS